MKYAALSLLVAVQASGGTFKTSPSETSSTTIEPALAVYNPEGLPSGYRPTFFPPSHEGFFFSAEFLYMQATVDGLAYAWSFPEAEPSLGDTLVRSTPIPGGQFHDIDFRWSPGVRLGVGRHFSLDNWEVTAMWTGFESTSRGSATVDNLTSNSLFALWMPFGYIAASYDAEHAAAKYRLNYNVVDLDMGRAAFAVKSIVFGVGRDRTTGSITALP